MREPDGWRALITPRLPHGMAITLDEFRNARDTLADRTAEIPLSFAAM